MEYYGFKTLKKFKALKDVILYSNVIGGISKSLYRNSQCIGCIIFILILILSFYVYIYGKIIV